MSEINSISPTIGTDDTSESGTQIEHKKIQEKSTKETDIMDTSADPTPTITAVPPAPATGVLSPPPPLGVQDTNKQPVSYIRSQSPAKRPASEMNGEDEAVNYATPSMTIDSEQGGVPMSEPDIASSESAPPTSFSAAQSSSATKVPESTTESGVLAATATRIETPPTLAPSATTAPPIPSRPSSPPPTIDQQITTVMLGIHRPLEEGEEYCIISGKWLKKFMSKEKESDIVLTKEEAEEELGPIDNSELVDKIAHQKMITEGVILLDPTNAGIPADVNGTAAEAEFSPLAQGVLGEDFEVIPFDTWEFLVNIHGVAKSSPPPLKRKAVNTQTDTKLASNIQVELYPPTFTVYKLRDPSAEPTHASLGVGAKPAPKILAGRSEKVQALLRKAKNLAGIDMSRKVRIWRLMNNEGASLSDSRALSLVNGKKDNNKGMIYDMAAFLDLDSSSEKELVANLEDRTNDKNYNGKFSINMAGLGDGGDILLEEQDSSGNWISEQASKTAKSNGGMLSRFGNLINRKANSATSSRSSSPARNANTNRTSVGIGNATNIMSRGREKKPGRPLGCCGLQNLGNTCYMNSALQCLRNCEELTRYFLFGKYKGELNPQNPLAHGGNVAKSYADLLGHMFAPSSPASHAPRQFKNTIGRYGPSFSGYGQQDSQEFLAFLLDGLHEDLNRIRQKPYMEKPDSTDEMVGNEKLIAELADKCWNIYKARNDSAVADLFGGMYKSTLVCPVCEKVSITFDPFMDLTLPLPVENVWSKEVVFYPAGGKNLLKIPVDMDKNSTIKGLKEYIGNKLKIDPQKIMGSELYKNKFFKHYEDAKSVSAEIPLRDNPIFYELDGVPTNYPPPKLVRSMITRNDWDDDKLMERLIVPVFNWKKSRISDYFGMPFFIVLDREDQKDYYSILAKICERYQSQTSMPLFDSHDESGTETPDQIVMVGEDESINEGKRVSEKDEDEGYVDVQMEDVGEDASAKVFGKYSRETLDKLASLFTMKIGAKSHGSDRTLHTGWSNLQIGIDLASRIVRQRAPTPPPRKQYHGRLQAASDESDEDESQGDTEAFANAPETQDSDDDVDGQVHHSFGKGPGNFGASSPGSFYGKPNMKKSGLYKATASDSRPGTPSYSTSQWEEQGPLLRLGEAIICEWEDGTYDSVFGGLNKDDDMRGYPLWEPEEIALYQDEELAARRRLRENRRKRGIHLEDCLAEFAKEEILSETDPWYCPRCKEFRRARKKFELWKSPDILVVHLKRFSSSRISRDKIDALIDFPVEGLDLNDRIGLREDGKENIYDLFAVDNHYGGLGGGHYTAYAKNFENGLWYYFDDSSVSAVGNPGTIVTPAAYLLFYRRRTTKPLGGPVFEKLLGDSGTSSQEDEEESGNGNGNDSGISDNSPSSSPRMRGMIGGHDYSDNSISSSPLVFGRASNSITPGYKSFGGAGSSSTLFDTAPSSILPPSPQGSSSSSGQPPSYAETLVEERLFGPQLPSRGVGYDDSFGGPATTAPKSVNFTFGHAREAENLHQPTTPTSTAGDVGDSDRDADAEEDVDMDMLGGIDIVDDSKQKFQTTEFVGIGEGVGIDEEEDCEGSVHEFELSPGEGDNEEEGELVEREGVPEAVNVTSTKVTVTAATPPPETMVTTTEKGTTGEATLAGKMDTST